MTSSVAASPPGGLRRCAYSPLYETTDKIALRNPGLDGQAMEHPTNCRRRWVRVLLGAVSVACAWFSALAVESATRLMVGLFAQFGADLPTPTLQTIYAVQIYAPWIVAAVSTLIIFYLGIRASAYFLHACAIVAAIAALFASFVVLSLVLPIIKCGVFWPEWPHQSSGASAKSPGVAHSLASPGSTQASSCR
jgi:hypothetical protein